MNIIIDLLIYTGKCIYSTLPPIFANMAPIITQKIKILNYPLDFGLKIKGKPVLGPKKTFRGLISGILFSMVIMNIEFLIYKFTPFKTLTIFDFETINFQALAFLMGFGVIFGDSVESFIKRRLEIPPGKKFIPWDQLDCVLGGLSFGRIVWPFPIKYGIIIIIATFFIHITIRHIAYYLGINETKW